MQNRKFTHTEGSMVHGSELVVWWFALQRRDSCRGFNSVGLESIFIIRLPNGPGIPAVLALRVREIRKRKQGYLQDHILHAYGVDGVVITTLVKVPQSKWNSKPSWGWLGISHLSSFVSFPSSIYNRGLWTDWRKTSDSDDLPWLVLQSTWIGREHEWTVVCEPNISHPPLLNSQIAVSTLSPIGMSEIQRWTVNEVGIPCYSPLPDTLGLFVFLFFLFFSPPLFSCRSDVTIILPSLSQNRKKGKRKRNIHQSQTANLISLTLTSQEHCSKAPFTMWPKMSSVSWISGITSSIDWTWQRVLSPWRSLIPRSLLGGFPTVRMGKGNSCWRGKTTWTFSVTANIAKTSNQLIVAAKYGFARLDQTTGNLSYIHGVRELWGEDEGKAER